MKSLTRNLKKDNIALISPINLEIRVIEVDENNITLDFQGDGLIHLKKGELYRSQNIGIYNYGKIIRKGKTVKVNFELPNSYNIQFI